MRATGQWVVENDRCYGYGKLKKKSIVLIPFEIDWNECFDLRQESKYITITGHCEAWQLAVICLLSDFSISKYSLFLITIQPNCREEHISKIFTADMFIYMNSFQLVVYYGKLLILTKMLGRTRYFRNLKLLRSSAQLNIICYVSWILFDVFLGNLKIITSWSLETLSNQSSISCFGSLLLSNFLSLKGAVSRVI